MKIGWIGWKETDIDQYDDGADVSALSKFCKTVVE
jgi:hypothetical protein